MHYAGTASLRVDFERAFTRRNRTALRRAASERLSMAICPKKEARSLRLTLEKSIEFVREAWIMRFECCVVIINCRVTLTL